MKRHVKIYLDYFGYGIDDFIPCEIPNRPRRAVDINHIKARGFGGNPSGDKDVIENLQALCREHHIQFGDYKQHREYLIQIHKEKLKNK